MPGDPTSNMLAAYNAGVYAVLQSSGVPSYPQTESYVSTILALEPSFAAVTGTVPPSSAAAAAVVFAEAAVGIPYRWAGDGGSDSSGGFDCSGLTQAAYAISGIRCRTTPLPSGNSGAHIPADQLQPGDLVFFASNLNDPSTIRHVGIYIDNGQMID